ncbi:hypothetical protein [Nocardia iowensis]|uniref:Uncharacterized protein n=1 Tax=Nocardia iowensis TaxID=204891 RepID=A0ABX8RU60_NOCIO|nr:hypothetical protein [Nocardia iowensis]QXN91880.1 hypothetical protein KV110_01410 [Nocardia iowensis]
MTPNSRRPLLALTHNGPTVHVITSGTGADYQIVRIFTDPAEAGVFLVGHNARPENDQASIEEWAITQTAPEQILWWRVRWDHETETIDPPEQFAQWTDELSLFSVETCTWRTTTGDIVALSTDRARAVAALIAEVTCNAQPESGAS